MIYDRALTTHYKMTCHRKGKLIWTSEYDNIVVNEGLDDSLDKHLKGSAYTAAWYVGLCGNGTKDAGDTAAEIGGTNAWAEVTSYDEATRPTLVLGAVSSQSVDNVGNLAVFTVNATVSIYGCFLASSNVKDGTSGVLYSEGDFTDGVRNCKSADVLSVTVTCTTSAS